MKKLLSIILILGLALCTNLFIVSGANLCCDIVEDDVSQTGSEIYKNTNGYNNIRKMEKHVSDEVIKKDAIVKQCHKNNYVIHGISYESWNIIKMTLEKMCYFN